MLIDRNVIEKELLKICKRGTLDAAGHPAYNPVVLFKMMLLQTWYGLSDICVKDMVNENLSAMEFCGLILEDDVPDQSTLSRFRKELTGKKFMDRMLRKINNQLAEHKAYRNRPLTQAEKRFNILISKSRRVVERTFGSIKRWFGTGWARYKGLKKMHTPRVIEAIAHNLKRAPGIIMSNALK